jgi:glucosamine 6-phosphate synthetase-like amidotransferase/phosphosugar isomerase protein
MQFQLSISIDDLREILINLEGTTTRFAIRSIAGELLDKSRLLFIDRELDIISAELGATKRVREISIYQIEAIEFESFHQYRGQSARTFSIL